MFFFKNPGRCTPEEKNSDVSAAKANQGAQMLFEKLPIEEAAQQAPRPLSPGPGSLERAVLPHLRPLLPLQTSIVIQLEKGQV